MKNILIFIFCGFQLLSFAQSLTLTNQKTIGGTLDDSQRLFPAENGNGYYLIGISDSPISGDKTEDTRGLLDIWITRVSNDLTVLWDKTIGGDLDERFAGAVFEDDKIFISTWTKSGISGEKTMDSFGLNDCWILCLDTNANILWQEQYGGNLDEGYSKIVALSDSSILLVTQSRSPISGNKTTPTINGTDDLWIVEIAKSDGHIIQQKTIGSMDDNRFPSVIKSTFNDRIYISSITSVGTSGDKTDTGHGLKDVWMIVLDEDLNTVQDKCFGGNLNENFAFLKQIDNSIFLTVATYSDVSGNKATPHYGSVTTNDAWVVKLDHNLNIIWENNLGGIGNETAGTIVGNPNGNLIFSAMSDSDPSGNKTAPHYGNFNDSWLVVLNSSGTIVSQETFGGNGDDGNNFQEGVLFQKPNATHELIYCASSTSGISGNKTVPSNGSFDTWIGTIDASYYLKLESFFTNSSRISVFPNPFSSSVQFNINNISEDTELTIFTTDGKLVANIFVPNGHQLITWKPSNEESLFFYKISGETHYQSGKIVKF